MDPTFLIGWLEKLGLAILAGLVGAFVSPMLLSRFQEQRRVKRDHLDTIKEQVLRPLREELERLYLPLLQGELGPVTLGHVVIPVEGSVTQSRTTWDWTLAKRRNPVRQVFPIDDTSKSASEITQELYEDAKRHHYRRFIRKLEAFKAGVESYTDEWMAYAEELSQVVVDCTGLPVVTAALANTGAPWVNARGLAVFVVDWQLGVIPQGPIRGPDGRSLQMSGQTMAQVSTEEAIQRILDVLDELCHDRGRVEDLQGRAEPLVRETIVLLGEIDQLLLTSKLPGRCRLTKV